MRRNLSIYSGLATCFPAIFETTVLYMVLKAKMGGMAKCGRISGHLTAGEAVRSEFRGKRVEERENGRHRAKSGYSGMDSGEKMNNRE